MIVFTIVAAFGAAIYAYLNPPPQIYDAWDRTVCYWTHSETHEFKTVLNPEVFADVNPNLLATEQTARDAATAYIEKQVKEGTLPPPHGISYVIPTSFWTVDHQYWLVRFHLDDDYTSGNFIEILVRMDGVVIEPAVQKRTVTAGSNAPREQKPTG